jgi:hypothetical protein
MSSLGMVLHEYMAIYRITQPNHLADRPEPAGLQVVLPLLSRIFWTASSRCSLVGDLAFDKVPSEYTVQRLVVPMPNATMVEAAFVAITGFEVEQMLVSGTLVEKACDRCSFTLRVSLVSVHIDVPKRSPTPLPSAGLSSCGNRI